MSFSTDPKAPQHRPWGIPATIAWLLFAFLASVLAATVVFGAIQPDRASLRSFGYDGVVITIGAMSSVPVQIAMLTFAARMKGWAPSAYFGLVPPKRAEIVFAVLCTVALVAVFNLAMVLSGRELVPAFQVEAYQTAKDAGWLVALLVAIVLVAPIGEELVFRGFLYRGFVRPGHERLAIVIIALAWALLHIQYDWLGMAQIFTAGLILGWLRWASGSTVVTIVMHVLINAEAMMETVIKVEWLT